MSILRGLHIVLWIIAFTAAAVAYDWHLRQVDQMASYQDQLQGEVEYFHDRLNEQQGLTGAQTVKAHNLQRELQILEQKLTDTEELYQDTVVEASKLKADADSAWVAYYASADEAAEWQGKAQSLNIKAKLLEAAVDGLTPEPVTNPDPMSATVKLSIEGGGHGSGTHIGGGYIITAGHVAEKEGDKLTARFQNGDEYEAVTLWSNRAYDIALVKIEAADAPASNLECRTPEPGEELRFLGNPLAMEWVTTRGYVAGPTTGAYSKAWDTVLPVDAAMAGGMSGGGAFDADGDLVGVNVGIPVQQFSWGDGSATGISFIVPAETLCGLLART